MKLILLGAPGAGKGTLAEQLVKAYSIPTISTGNILRENVAKQTELGKSAKGYMDQGALVPDGVVIGMLQDRIAEPDCENGFILDGFPRTIPQAVALNSICSIDQALSIEVADEVIKKRMTGRRACPNCGATYHIETIVPKVEGKCDKCGADLTIRQDDKPEVVIDRLKTYHEQTEPLKAFYAGQRKLISIDGEGLPEETRLRALKALNVECV